MKEIKHCIEEDCDRKVYARSLCSMHYEQRRRNGLPMPPKISNTTTPGYRGMHYRIKAVKGKASEYLCACGCGEQAREWALAPDAKDLITDKLTGKKYSIEIEDYIPLAIRCHRELDGNMPPEQHRFGR